MVFTLISQSRIDGQDRCFNLFKMSTKDYTTGVVSVNVDSLLDCWGDYQIEVQVNYYLPNKSVMHINILINNKNQFKANDLGDDILGVQSSDIKKYRICVKDVNNNDPVFVFPAGQGSIINVQEVSYDTH